MSSRIIRQNDWVPDIRAELQDTGYGPTLVKLKKKRSSSPTPPEVHQFTALLQLAIDIINEVDNRIITFNDAV